MLKSCCVVLLIVSLIIAVIFIGLVIFLPNSSICRPSITTASGSAALPVCSGYLIFEEDFSKLDKSKWQPEVTLSGGGNGEFEWYVADDDNSFEKGGKLYIKPTLTSSKIGRYEVEIGYVHLTNCTDPDRVNCERQAGENVIINPIQSARLNTKNSFSFKYGRIEVIAKLPKGDWLWPAVWLLPTQRKYGEWPRSGEIDLLESRGNFNYTNQNGTQIGAQQVTSTLHFGPEWDQDGYRTAQFTKNNDTGYDNDFHKYGLVWNESGFTFSVDDIETGSVMANDRFWKRGRFNGDDIWSEGSDMAPFDQEFHFIINLAVGGTNGYFPDTKNQSGNKPWNDSSPSAMRDFWMNRKQWQSTWNFDTDDSSFIINSIKVWAI